MMSSCIDRYLTRLGAKSQASVRSILSKFFMYLKDDPRFGGLSPDELLAYQTEHKGYEVLDAIQGWIRAQPDLRLNTKKRYYSVVKALFSHNRVPMPPDPAYRTPGSDTPAVQGGLTVGELKRVIDGSSPMYRAAIVCAAQGFMGAHELIYWSSHGLESLRAQLEGKAYPLKVDMPVGRKHNPDPFYTYIGRDGVEALRRYFEVRPESDEAIFLTRYRTPLSETTMRHYWTDKLKRLQLITPRVIDTEGVELREVFRIAGSTRYGKNFHEIRDTMKSRARLTGVDPEVVEFFMGHDLDQYGYDKSPKHYEDWFREQYLRAEPWLNILSEDPTKISRSDHEYAIRREREQSRNMIRMEVERQLLEREKRRR